VYLSIQAYFRLQCVQNQLHLLYNRTCTVNFIGCHGDNGLFLNWTLSRVRHGCLDCRCTYSMKFTITIRLELYVQLQLFSYSSNQPLYHLQRERFVQPLLQSGTLLMSTPVLTFLTFKNRLKTELF